MDITGGLITMGLLGLLGGGLQAGGNLLGGAMQSSDAKTLQRRAQRFEAKQAQINRDYMERLSNTAHQREVADLRSAGLNPILSATGGAGASVPSASTAVSGNMPEPVQWSKTLGDAFSAPVEQAMRGVSSAVSLYKGLADVKNTDASTDNLDTASQLNRAKAATERFNGDIKRAEAKYAVDKHLLGARKAYEEYRKAVAEADKAFDEADLSRFGRNFTIDSDTGRELWYRRQVKDTYKNGWLGDFVGGPLATFTMPRELRLSK